MRLHYVLLPLLCSTAACAAGGHEPPAPAPGTATVQAVEVGCPYAKSSRVRNTVTLSFVVLKNGSVAP